MHFDAIEAFEHEVGLPNRWYFSLLQEGDWSFVIKLYALFEAAITHAVEAKVQPEPLKKFVASLNIGGQFGKLTLAESLDVMEANQLKFVRALSAIRNRCVHDVRNVQFKIEAYFAAMTEPEQRVFLGLLEGHFADPMAHGTTTVDRDVFLKSNLKMAVWVVASKIIAELFDKSDLAVAISQIRPGTYGGGPYGSGPYGG